MPKQNKTPKPTGGKKEFNGYSFEDKSIRRHMKFLIIFEGDLDLNGAYAFRNKTELKKYLKDCYKEPEAVFEIKDLTEKYL